MFIKHTSFLWLCFLLMACEMVVHVDVPNSGSQIVVNSFFHPDTTWYVGLTKSRFILDQPNHNLWYENKEDDPYIIKNADVRIFEGDELVDILSYDGAGIYRSSHKKPEAGKKYSLKVSAPDFKPVEARDQVPQKIKLLSVDVKKEPFVDSQLSDNLYSLTVKFKDPGGMKNYYMLSMYGETSYDYNNIPGNGESEEKPPVEPIPVSVSFFSSDPSLVGNDWSYTFNTPLCFSDDIFDGREAEIKINFYHYYWESGSGGMTLYVYLYHASAVTHFYNVSVGMQQSSSGDPFSQPVVIRSNMSNGMGIFGGLNYDVYKIGFKPEN